MILIIKQPWKSDWKFKLIGWWDWNSGSATENSSLHLSLGANWDMPFLKHPCDNSKIVGMHDMPQIFQLLGTGYWTSPKNMVQFSVAQTKWKSTTHLDRHSYFLYIYRNIMVKIDILKIYTNLGCRLFHVHVSSTASEKTKTRCENNALSLFLNWFHKRWKLRHTVFFSDRSLFSFILVHCSWL